MEDTLAQLGIIGTLIPLLIAFLRKYSWGPMATKILVIVVSVAAALVSYFAEAGGWQGWQPLLVDFGVIYGTAVVTYQHFWKGTAVTTKLADVGNPSGP